jgi:hypothetical protein
MSRDPCAPALDDPDHHPLTVDIAGLQTHHRPAAGAARAGGRGAGSDHATGDDGRGTQLGLVNWRSVESRLLSPSPDLIVIPVA